MDANPIIREALLKTNNNDFINAWKTLFEPDLKRRYQIHLWNPLQVAALIPSLFAQFNAGLTQAARHAVIAARSYKQLVDDNPEVELTLHPKEETICRKEIEKRLGLKLPIILDNPEKWVPLPAQSLSTQRSDEFWVMCSGNPKKPVFEVLTKEFVVAFAWELFKTAEMLSNTKQLSNITILEVGCGDGSLSTFLSKEIDSIPKQSGFTVKLFCCDDSSDGIQESCHPILSSVFLHTSTSSAIQQVRPNIIISSWMPLGVDWTEEFRQCCDVYFLIGAPHVCGINGKSWVASDGWEQSLVPQVSQFQISRLDTKDSIGHSSTTKFIKQ